MTDGDRTATNRNGRKRGAGKLTPRATARAVELAKADLPTREIAATLKREGLADVHHGSIARLLERQRDDATGNTPAPPPSVDADASLPDGAPADLVRSRLAEVRAMAVRTKAGVEAGTTPLVQWSGLLKLEAELAAKLAALTPTTPDPEGDPADRALEARLVRDVLDRIEDAERRVGSLCSKCLGEIDHARGRVGA